MRPVHFLTAALLCGGLVTTVQAQQVVFHRRDVQQGDTSRQELKCDLDLTMSIRQGGQTVQEQKQLVQRLQRRELTILEATPGLAKRAQVRYDNSTVSLQAAEQQPQESVQPVSGKTYLVARDGEKLSITYADGGAPPDEERTIVQDNMQTFGLPNPIASFFDGKSVAVGQTLQLPKELAQDLLGFTATGNTVSDFAMKLVEVRPAAKSGLPVALFDLRLKAEDPDNTGVAMTLSGQMIMEVDTCRTQLVTLFGPVVASEHHGPSAAQYELHSEGRIDVAVTASFLSR